MYLIIGLGNPESDYANTRHNMGFNVINEISKKYSISVTKKRFNGIYGVGNIEGEKVILLKPQTYMNNSGEAITQFINYYKINLENIIVVYDDIDIMPGQIRIRKNGSAGSHNGMKSVINCLKTESFKRVRVGIGKPKDNTDLIEYVIGGIDQEDKENLKKGIELAKDAVIEIIKNNVDIAMNKYN